jgi:hypothetical protein
MAPVAAFLDPDLLAGCSVSALRLGVIKEARHRQRRRHTTLAVVIAASVLAVLVGFVWGGGGSRPPTSPGPQVFGPAKTVIPTQVFAETPYMGVSCPTGDSIACDRVGLAVWVRKPATVTATVDGSLLKLNDPTWSIVEHIGSHSLYRYAGFLQPFMWFARHTTSASVWFHVDFGHGSVVITHEDVPLEPGWG